MKSNMSPIAIALLLMTGIAHAEVSDKAASISQIWWCYLAVGVVALLLARYRFALGLVMLPVELLLIFINHDTLSDPYVGKALLAEQGSAYAWATYGGAVVMLLLLVIGLWLGWRKGGLVGDGRAA